MPLIIRVWLVLSSVFATLIHVWAKRTHTKQGIHQDRFPERLGIATAARSNGRWIWVHAASLGEVGQTAQLVANLQDIHGFNVLVTTLTGSGANWAAKNLPNAVHQFAPLDTPLEVRNFLDTWSPEMAVFIESDIWPRLVLEAAARQIPLALVNARPSKSRDRAPRSYRFLLSHFCAITCKSSEVLDGFRNLGIAQDRLFDFGDLRASAPPLAIDQDAVDRLQTAVSDRPVWIAASSHAGDEAEIIKACKHVLLHQPNALLIWAPRHPKRAKYITDAASDIMIAQRSTSQAITPDTQIYLADTLGELGTLFSCSKIVFLGGSFGTEGGHNPYEPACFGCYVITGLHVQNHQAAFAHFREAGAATTVSSGTELGEHVVETFALGRAAHNGEKGRNLVRAADASVEKTCAMLVAQLSA